LISDEKINPQSLSLSAFIDIPNDTDIGIYTGFLLSKLPEEIFLLPSISFYCDYGEGTDDEKQEIRFERWDTIQILSSTQGMGLLIKKILMCI